MEDVLHSGDAVTPQGFELVQQRARGAEGVRLDADDLLAAAAAFLDQSGTLQHTDVLLHCRQAHVVAACERRDGVLSAGRPPQDVAAGAIGQRLKYAIGQGFAVLIYNHTVAG